MKSVISKLTEASKIPPKEGFLLSKASFVSEQHGLSLNGSPISWKAGTLPLSYSRKRKIILALMAIFVKGVSDR